MKKITLLFALLMLFISASYGQISTVPGCTITLGTNTYGPMFSVSGANATSRVAVLYPSSQLTSFAGQTLTSLYFKRLEATGSISPGGNFKIYLKETTNTDFGAAPITWATEITGATLVYDSDPSAPAGANAGWKGFPFLTNFIYSGTQNLAVYLEYLNPAASSGITWIYDYTLPCVNTANSNTTKYSNNQTGVQTPNLGSTNYRRPYIGFDYLVSCNAPNTLTASAITTTSATINWVENATQPANGYQYYYSTSSTAPTPTATPSGTTATGIATVNLSGLLSGTTYNFWVRGNCGTTDKSVWSGPSTFTTVCAPVTDYVQTFDTSATGVGILPNCWSRLGTSANIYNTIGSVAPMSPANRLYMSISATTTAFAVLPSVSNLQAGTHRLKFKAYASAASKKVRVGYFASPSDIATYVILQEIDLPSTAATAAEFVVIPTAIPAGVQNLVLSLPEGSLTNVYLDDFKWEAIPSCPDTTNLVVGGITATGANASWDALSGVTGYEYAVTTSATPPTSGTATSNTFGVVSGLLPQTVYYLHVRSTCTGSSVGLWSTSTSFLTACAPVTFFTENFDTSPTGTNNLPVCWSKAGTSANVYNTTGSVAPMTPANRLFMSITATTTAYAILPPVSTLQAETYRLKFKGYSTTASKKIRVGYFTNSADLTSFTLIQEFDLPSTAATTAIEFAVYPTSVPAGVTNLVLTLPEGTATTAYFDDFKWELSPACPDTTNLVVGGITATGTNVSWDALSSVTGYEYAVTTSATPPASGTATTSTFAIISGLNPQTVYYLHVRSACSGGTFGNWTTATSFTTLCAPLTILPWNEGFEGITTVGLTAFPPCWLKENGDYATAIAGTYNTPNTGTKYLRDSYAATNEYMWTPGFNLTAGTSYDFSSYVQGDGYTGWVVDYFVNSTQSSSGASQLGTSYSPLGTGTASIQSYSYVNRTFVPTTTGVYYFAVRVNQPLGSPWYLAFDDFELKLSPACPVQTGLVANGVTSTGANASWDAMSGAVSYEYAVTTSATPPVSGTATTTTYAILSGLAPQTTYYLYVRSICAGATVGGWASPFSFTTLCASVTAFTQNFDGVTASTLPSGMPTCWSKVGSLGTCYTSTATPVASAPNVLYLFGSTTAAPTMRMQPVSNLGSGTHRIKFKMRGTSATVFPNLAFGYLTNPADAATFVTLTTFASTGLTFTTYTYSPPAGTYSNYPAVKMNGAVYGALYLDDFAWEPNPSCPDQTGLTIGGATTTSANASWDAITGAAGYEYAVTTSATPPTSGTATTATFQAVSGLTPQTLYYLHVRSMCSAGVYGNWATTSFLTGYCIPSSTNTTTYVNSFVTTGGSQNISNLATGYSTGGYNNATSQIVAGFATSTFNFNAAIIGGTAGFSIWIDWNNDLVFDNATEKFFNTTTYGSGPFTGTITIPAGTAVGNYRMRIVTDYLSTNPSLPCGAPTTAEFEDYTISVVAPPACGAPAPLSSNVVNVSATLSWPAIASALVGYEYVLDGVVTNPVAAGTTTTATTFNATALSANTTYYFHIRSVCSVGTYSTWTTISFTTSCAPENVPYSQNFETATVPNLPVCTIQQNVGTGNLWVTAANPGYGFTTNTLRYNYNGASPANVWFYTNGINLVAGTSYKISYDYGSTGTTFPEKLKVAYGTSAAATAMTTVLADHPNVVNGTAPINTIVNFTPTTSGVYYFGFNAYSAANQFYLFVDNIMVDVLLGNDSFNTTSFTVYPNPVKDILHINYNDAITKIQVVNMLGQEIITKSVNNTQNEIDMSGLVQGTYLVKITSNDRVKTIKVIKQ